MTATKNQRVKKKKKSNLTDEWRDVKTQKDIVGEVDVDRLLLDVISGNSDIDITESFLDGNVSQTIEGASAITMMIHDFDRKLLKTGVLSDGKGHLRTAEVVLDDGTTWRLCKFRKTGDDLELTFEEREVSLLRVYKGPRKARRIVVGGRVRDGLTRAQFVLSLIRRSKKYGIKTSIPELNQLQDVDKISRTKTGKEKVDKNRGKGFPEGLKIKGVNATMLENIAVFLTAADRKEKDVPELAYMAGLCAGFGESGWSKKAVSPSGKHKGVFQSSLIPPEDLEGQSKAFLNGGRSFHKDGAVGLARKHPDWTPGKIATTVEISDGSPEHYDKYRALARRILKEWGGAPSGSSSKTATKKYEFSVGADETYWDAIIRLAGEVGRRAFVVAGVFYWISEEDLYNSRVRYRFSEDTPGIENIDFDWDYGKAIATATVECHIAEWAAPPGTIVMIDEMGPLSETSDPKSDKDRKWLVSTISRPLFSTDATITLKKPMPELPEPKDADGDTEDNRGADGGAKTIGDGLSYPLQTHGKSLGGVAAHNSRAWGNWQSDNAVDIAVKRGTEVYAVEDGKITKLGGAWRGGSGNPDGFNVTISAGGRQWFYTHLQSRKNLTVGQSVKSGDLLGRSGAAAGVEHLHIAVSKGDPERILKV